MQTLTRRLFLRNVPPVLAVGTTIAAPAIAEAAKPMTPEERIDAAVEEIIAAYREKWPDAPIRVGDFDNIDTGMLLILTHVSGDKPGTINFQKRGKALPRETFRVEVR